MHGPFQGFPVVFRYQQGKVQTGHVVCAKSCGFSAIPGRPGHSVHFFNRHIEIYHGPDAAKKSGGAYPVCYKARRVFGYHHSFAQNARRKIFHEVDDFGRVSFPGISSSSFITQGGLKKWRPGTGLGIRPAGLSPSHLRKSRKCLW